MSTRRVVITGIGPVTPVGTGRATFAQSLVEGRSGIGPLTRFDVAGFPVRAAGEVHDFRPEDYVDGRKARRVERFALLGLAAARLAIQDAGLPTDELDPGRVGVVIGTAYGGTERLAVETTALRDRGWKAIPPEISMSMLASVAASLIAMEYGFTGPTECPATGCAASGHALSRSADLIWNGSAEVILAGGCDAPLHPIALSAFAAARALSTRGDDPATACRPFDAHRDGFVISEGATVLVLEELARSKARGARPYAEIVGYGHTADAYNLAQPRPDGRGAAAAMTTALQSAQRPASEVGYVNAHAAGTPSGDAAEVAALHRVFGSALPPVSSTKSMHGHLMGAAGATEVAATALALHHGVLPPTAHYEHVDPACAIDVVPNHAREATVGLALSNSFALGGLNCSLALARI